MERNSACSCFTVYWFDSQRKK